MSVFMQGANITFSQGWEEKKQESLGKWYLLPGLYTVKLKSLLSRDKQTWHCFRKKKI